MSTRPKPAEPRRNRPLPFDRAAIAVGAVAYWLEDDEGYPVWWERPTPDAALTIAARGFENGMDPKALVLVARTSSGHRRVVATGSELRAMAELFKPVRSPEEQAAIDRWRKAMIGPVEIEVDGAVSYWIERSDGRQCSTKFERSNQALAAAHEAIVTGADAADLELVCHLENGERYEVSHGVALEDLARSAVGLPARPHRVTQGPPYPLGTSRGSSSRRPTGR